MPQTFKNMKAEDVQAAYKEVLGREANAAELTGFTTNNIWFRDAEDLKRGIASTREAQKRGVDLSKYGDSYVDSAEGLDQKRSELFAALKEVKGRGYRIRKSELDAWALHGNAAKLRASAGAKSITLQNATAQVYSGDSLKYLMNAEGKVDDANFEAGDFFLVPKGTTLKGRLKIAGEGKQLGDDYAEYDIVQKTARERSGVMGSTMKAVGFSKGAANSFEKTIGKAAGYSIITPAGILSDEAAAILGGTRGAQGRAEALDKVGIDGDRLRKIDYAGDIATSVAASAIDVLAFDGAPILSSANTLVNQLEAESLAQADRKSWRDAATSVAVSWASHGMTKGLGKLAVNTKEAAVKSGGSLAAARAAGAAQIGWKYAGPYATARATGASSEDAFMSAAQSAVVGAMPSGSLGAAAFRAGVAGAFGYARASKNDADSFNTALGVGASAADAFIVGQAKALNAWDSAKASMGLQVGTAGTQGFIPSLEAQRSAFLDRQQTLLRNRTTINSVMNPYRRAELGLVVPPGASPIKQQTPALGPRRT